MTSCKRRRGFGYTPLRGGSRVCDGPNLSRVQGRRERNRGRLLNLGNAYLNYSPNIGEPNQAGRLRILRFSETCNKEHPTSLFVQNLDP
jgi:hypothetical protein